MNETTPNTPKTTSPVPVQNVVPSLESIAAKMTAMRNQPRATSEGESGPEAEAIASEPVAAEMLSEDQEISAETADADSVAEAPEEVSEARAESNTDDMIDFIEFAESNPQARFKFTRNGKEVIVDAKKAAAILGQGSAIHEDARQLKVERAEFDEYLKSSRERQEGLTLAMEFTVQPQLQKAYDEIVKTQGYQTTFQQQLASTADVASRARIQASMQQNETYIQQQQGVIGELKPAVDQFRDIRRQQVSQVLENNRKSFKDKELKNEYVYNEIREKIAKVWPESKAEIIPGIPNIDLISSDENLMALVRDGLKYRNASKPRSAGNSIAQLTQRRGNSTSAKSADTEISRLREQAKTGGKAAGDNLLMQRLSQIRGSRGGR